ncbi:MAG TPA: 4'-phosphopantetheinyl transferase superfamily protein [Kofleriaceae bacterium]|nr:4'-phosphopantetheinyl transferase superfamily protein [Kofleriaceae bacterium]
MTWEVAPAAPALGPRAVHVWRVPLVPSHAEVAALGETLSADERTRAAKFYFERDRRAFTVARGALRTVLGRYLGVPAAAIGFAYRARGKPYLATPGDRGLAFNLSHSGGFALIAVARQRELGVDVEQRRAIDDLVALAETSFSPREFEVFRALPRAQHVEAFFTCWSRKEAFIKATGEGVAQLADFDVTLRPGEPAQILWIRDTPAPHPWALHELPAIADHAAALVVARGAPDNATDDVPDDVIDLACYRWSPLTS